jgi:hypothetical protein
MNTKLAKRETVIKPEVKNKHIQTEDPTAPTTQPQNPKSSNHYAG